MANETVLRKAPDEPRRDPLAELARIIGDDNLYADLLMNRTRAPDAPEPPHEAERPAPEPSFAALDDDESEIPAMPLRIDQALSEETPPEPAPSLNWEELERDLARFSLRENVSPPPPAPVVDRDEPQEDELESWQLRGFDEPEQRPYENVAEPAFVRPEIAFVPPPPAYVPPPPVELMPPPAAIISPSVYPPAQDPFAVPADAFDQVDESLNDIRNLAAQAEEPLDEAQEFARFLEAEAQAETDAAAQAERDIYDFERRAADILDDERANAEPSTHAMLAGAGAAAVAGAALANWRGREPSVRAAAAESEPIYTPEGHMPPHGVHVFPEDAPRRKGGLATIGLVVGLAAAGALGVVGYRAMSGGTVGEPKLIKADNAPLKVPAAQESNNVAAKAIVDRMEPGQDKVVTREEQPLSAADQANQLKPPSIPTGPRVIPLSPPAADAPGATLPIAIPPSPPPPVTEPPIRTVRTVPVPGPGAAPTTPPVVTEAEKPAETPVAEPGSPPMSASLPLPRPADTEPRKVKTLQVSPDGRIAAQAPARQAAPARNPNAPLSIRPEDQPARAQQAQPQPQPQQEVAAVQPKPASGGGTFVVQITSVKSDAEARSAFSRLQNKHSVLSGYSPNIRVVDLGEKGTYHRVRVGPISRSDADNVCRQIKSGGGDCIVQSN